MASIMDETGMRADPPGAILVTQEIASRTRDTIIVRLRRQGLSFRAIGLVLNISRQRVHERYHSIPEPVRRHYASIPLG